MTLKLIPWALTNGGAASNPAERVRQAHQSHLGGTGVESSAALQVTALGTPNMSVNVAPGGVWIPGTLGSTTAQATNAGAQTAYGFPPTFTAQGSYYTYNDATVNLTISAANATNPRIDLVVATVQDADYSGGSNQAILQVITGTAAPSPVAPTPPASSLVLAQIAVAANATSITSGNITDTRLVAGFGGAAWSTYTPSAAGLPSGASVTLARYIQIGKTVHCRWALNANWAANTTYTLPLPVTALDAHWAGAGVEATGNPVWVQAFNTTTLSIFNTTAASGTIHASVTYEAA